MNEVMYDVPSAIIALALLLSMAAVIELGCRFGRWVHGRSTEATRDHARAVQGSLLGILALLLGFTFSIALNRHDARCSAVVEEANAIGTTWLRSQLLPESLRDTVARQLRDYIDLRVEASAITMAQLEERAALLEKANAVQGQLWASARSAASIEPNPVTTGLFIESLNAMIDSLGTRDAALNRHVPELVLFLLYAAFLMAGCTLGLTVGLCGHRPSLATYLMVVLIVVLVFIIVDLDRPRRGFIQVSQNSLIDLQSSIHLQVDQSE